MSPARRPVIIAINGSCCCASSRSRLRPELFELRRAMIRMGGLNDKGGGDHAGGEYGAQGRTAFEAEFQLSALVKALIDQFVG